MPVRSLTSSVLKWPDRTTAEKALREWAEREVMARADLLRLGYFGSYARGDWGVGSDLDIIAVVGESSEPFERRSESWDLSGLPVPAEILIYTREEWERLRREDGLFARTLNRDAVWLLPRQESISQQV
jgi:uncharacterized protein